MTIIDSREALEALPVGTVIRATEPDSAGNTDVILRAHPNEWRSVHYEAVWDTEGLRISIERYGDRYVRLYDTDPADAWEEGFLVGIEEGTEDDGWRNPYLREDDGA